MCSDVFFFFSSRRRHTRFDCDWSSDVCSSDLIRKRTYIGFLMFLLAQNVIILLFRFTNGPRVSMIRTLEGNGYLAQQFISALTVATFILLPIAYLLLPLYVSLVGGDLVAKVGEDR